ncbi:membrane hypothetical protein [uncultured Gammaproteobacteria bacterium]
MRQFLFAMVNLLLGLVLSTIFAFVLASNWRSFSDRWMIPLVFLPAIGVALGCWLAHKFSKGQDPWPITSSGGKILYTSLGAVGAAAASYCAYIAISSVWFEADFLDMLLSPSHIQQFVKNDKFGQHESSFVGSAIIGLLAGSYGTYRFITDWAATGETTKQ